MKTFKVLLAIAALAFVFGANAQKLPKKVSDVKLSKLTGGDATLPYFGKKNLLIFYVDPDKPNQNKAFTEEMEENHRASGEGIYGFGIMNLKDAPMVPNSLACKIANKRCEKNHALVLADKDRILSREWGLGDCNNVFVILIVTKEGELVYCKKGELNEAEKEEFYQIVDKYRH